MALADVIRSGVATAKSILGAGNLLPEVNHFAWDGTSRGGDGKPSLAAAVPRAALVEDVDIKTTDVNGDEVSAKIRILFLEYVVVRPEDKLVLADGRTGRILRIDRGPQTVNGQTFYVQVYL